MGVKWRRAGRQVDLEDPEGWAEKLSLHPRMTGRREGLMCRPIFKDRKVSNKSWKAGEAGR